MQRAKRGLWRYWFVEPFIWLLRCFFQPAGFQKDLEREQLRARLHIIVRMLIPIICVSYPLALLVRSLLYLSFQDTYTDYAIHGFFLTQTGSWLFAFDCLWALLASCVVGGLFGSLFNVVYGVALSMALGLANGIIVNNLSDALVGVVFGVFFGVLLGLTFNSVGLLKRSGLVKATLGIGIGLLLGLLVGAFTGIVGGYWVGFLVGLFGGPELQQSQNILGSVVGIIVAGISAGLLMSIVGSLIRSSSRRYGEVIVVGTRLSIAVATLFGVAIGTPVGDVGMHHEDMWQALQVGLFDVFVVGSTFYGGYILGFYRFPLYPLSALSMFRASLATRRQPQEILSHLRHSALCCDECVFLPLPCVRSLLLLAAGRSFDPTLDLLKFLLQERPQQRTVVQEAVVEIALDDLSYYESLRAISSVQQRLLLTLPQEFRLLDSDSTHIFRQLEDVSSDALSYYAHVSPPLRQKSLENIQKSLDLIHTSAAFRESALNRRLEDLIQRWRVVVKHELENITHLEQETDYIENPYVPGTALQLHDPLFVGRQDLAQRLGEALRRERRPTFFLSGERRMGKSSVLKQLPAMLGSQYLPIFYDLQTIGMASSTAALLGAIAEGIYEHLLTRGIMLKKLEYEQLREDQRENEEMVYHSFGRWLKELERLLEREQRVLLLAFDEFERLEEAGRHGQLDLLLLLNWFRSVIQNRPRIALLFCGVKNLGEMDKSWAGYFVNVETLKVSFLRPEEARRLITQPTVQFPGAHIFAEEVVAEIISMTGGHPFLIQAFCSIIITELNYEMRKRATLQDVQKAVEQVFEKWEDSYFRDLVERTNEEQRHVLRCLLLAKEAAQSQLQASSGLSESLLRHSLQQLQKRDLVIRKQDRYRIAAPIFGIWVERSI